LWFTPAGTAVINTARAHTFFGFSDHFSHLPGSLFYFGCKLFLTKLLTLTYSSSPVASIPPPYFGVNASFGANLQYFTLETSWCMSS
jgi:hypothetical protein